MRLKVIDCLPPGDYVLCVDEDGMTHRVVFPPRLRYSTTDGSVWEVKRLGTLVQFANGVKEIKNPVAVAGKPLATDRQRREP